MGMFDTISDKSLDGCKCRFCGKELSDWQTKSLFQYNMSLTKKKAARIANEFFDGYICARAFCWNCVIKSKVNRMRYDETQFAMTHPSYYIEYYDQEWHEPQTDFADMNWSLTGKC